MSAQLRLRPRSRLGPMGAHTREEFRVVGPLRDFPTIAAASQVRSPLSQSELADMCSVSGASMVHMIDRLVKAGLVIREPSISDRRVNRIVITDAGHRLCAELKNEAAAVRQQLLARIELEKLAHLTELLEQLQFILQPWGSRLETVDYFT